MIVTTQALLRTAYGRFAVGHYSCNNLEQVLAVARGNTNARAPFVLAFSRSARTYASPEMLEAIARAAESLFPELVFAVHLDHGDEETCHEATDSGVYSSVMIDASARSFEENVHITRRVVDHAHARGLSVEAELGALRGAEEDMSVAEGSERYTDPEEAARFVSETGCDSLAVAVGTVHGPHKFRAGEGISLDRLESIRQAVPGTPLVLHGSSTIPADELSRINAAGGAFEVDTRGVSAEETRAAVARGVAKINIDADSRLVWTRVHREYFRDHPDNIDFRKPGDLFMKEFAKLVVERSDILGSAGKLGIIRKELSLDIGGQQERRRT